VGHLEQLRTNKIIRGKWIPRQWHVPHILAKGPIERTIHKVICHAPKEKGER
jgi:hypothetical protein